jgi:hypothetical protein
VSALGMPVLVAGKKSRQLPVVLCGGGDDGCGCGVGCCMTYQELRLSLLFLYLWQVWQLCSTTQVLEQCW